MLRLCALHVTWHLLHITFTQLQVFALQSPLSCNLPGGKACVQLKYPSTISAESIRWAERQKLDSHHALTHSLFREVASHLRSSTSPDGSRSSCMPFLMKWDVDTIAAPPITFTCDDLESALTCDYLVACTGRSANTNDQHGGWRMTGLFGSSEPNDTHLLANHQTSCNYDNSQSFQSKRLHWTTMMNAQNTVVFNSAGAYISSKLAPTSLAATHGLNGATTGVCLNLYVTKADIQQSAPPHTDKQDVVVVQTQGRKRWRVYSPPDCAVKNNVDPFCRGKGADELTVPMLGDEGSDLLLDVILSPGDVLFVPARFPHTTDTISCYEDGEDDVERLFGKEDWSMHLTLGLDSHVWAMNYMSMRTLALRRFGIHDALEGNNDTMKDLDWNIEHGVGKVNQLSYDLREGLFSPLDETLFSLHRNDLHHEQELGRNVVRVASNLLAFHERTNFESDWIDTENTLTLDHCLETVAQFTNIGQRIMNTHEDMYNAALLEERKRDSEDGDWAKNVGGIMTKDRAERLSIFRVPVYFERLDTLREELRVWGVDQKECISSRIDSLLPVILKGDQVEVNLCCSSTRGNVNALGEKKISCWSSAKVVDMRSDRLFNLQMFDGTVKEGVERNNIKGPHGIGIFI